MATIKTCDVCGNPADTSDIFAIDRSLDAAGSVSTDTVSFDTCWKHRSMALDLACRNLSQRSPLNMYESSRVIVEAIKRLQSEVRK